MSLYEILGYTGSGGAMLVSLGFVALCMMALSHQNINHRAEIRAFMLFFLSDVFRSISVLINEYFHNFSIDARVFRNVTSLCEMAAFAYVCIGFGGVIKTLCDSKSREKEQEVADRTIEETRATKRNMLAYASTIEPYTTASAQR